MQARLLLLLLLNFQHIPTIICFNSVRLSPLVVKHIRRRSVNLYASTSKHRNPNEEHNTNTNTNINTNTVFKHIPISHNQNDNIHNQHVRKFPSLRTIAYTNDTNKPSNLTSDLKKLIIMIDIDGTICNISTDGNYSKSKPMLNNIAYFNELFDKGHEIHYWTARGAVSNKRWDEYTYLQLQKWCVKYTTLNMGKPHCDIWIDDKALNPTDISSKLQNLHK